MSLAAVNQSYVIHGAMNGCKNLFKFIEGLLVALTHISLAFFLSDIGKQCRPRSYAAECASDHGLPFLLTECSVKILIRMRMPKQPFNPLSLAFFLWDIGKQCRPRSDTAKVVSNQGLHCLLTECSIKI